MSIDKEGQLKRIDIDGTIYFDSILGIAGTTYPIGTRELPSNTIADVITLCALHNIRHINVRGVLVLGDAMTAYRFEGYKHLDIAHSVDLNSQDISVSSFHRLVITGDQAGAGLASYDDCILLTMTGFNGVATLCGLVTPLTLNAATSSGFIDCFSYLGACTINLGDPTVANFVNLSGSFILANQTAGVTNIWAANGCEIAIAASCTGGIINIYGNARVTGAGGGVTINNYSLQATISADGVYVDSVNGVAGTTWPIGTPGMPVTNFADAITIATARNLSIIYVHDNTYMQLTSPVLGLTFMGRAPIGVYGDNIDINGQNITSCKFINILVYDSVGGGNTLSADFYNATCEVSWDTQIRGMWQNVEMEESATLMSGVYLTAKNINFQYKAPNYCYLYMQGANTVAFYGATGRLRLEDVDDAGCVVEIYGNGIEVRIANTCTAGKIYLYGDVTIIDQSTGSTIYDYTNKPKAEVPANITAIVASETNFLNLATAGFHYTIDDLVLKCVDPGANTVNVRLYKLVNGVLTNTQTFAITNANFATYFDINTLFGLKSLAGDNIKITVQATAGGPYAVTGSYCYRSA